MLYLCDSEASQYFVTTFKKKNLHNFWKEQTISYLQVKIELSQEEHKGVEFLLGLCISSDSYISLFKLNSTSKEDDNLSFKSNFT